LFELLEFRVFLTNFFPFYFFFDSVEGFDRFRPLLAALAISFWGNKPISWGELSTRRKEQNTSLM
tara:strand:- start:2183 stop:2377 length:195 start_codon:yes stop_codon:yes gene_type:complete